jgi:pimeloyl-ACP methyl ester carboxylesterase
MNLTRAPRLGRPRLVIPAIVLAIAGLFAAISHRPSREFLRRSRHQQRRHRQQEREGTGLCRRIYTGQGRDRLRADHRQARVLLRRGPGDGLNFVSYPGEPSGDPDAYLKVAPDGAYSGFDACLANGVPADQAAILAATQRPIALGALTDPSGTPAWKTIPSWAVIGTADHVIPPAEMLFMAHRAQARITEINAGHLSLITNPGAVARVIIDAARATG